MILNADKLPDDPAVLKQMLIDFQCHFDKETGILFEQIQLLRAQLYGRKSEKVIPLGGPQQLPLFDMPEPEGLDEEPEEKVHVPEHTRKRGRKSLPEDLPRV
jgi:transposase